MCVYATEVGDHFFAAVADAEDAVNKIGTGKVQLLLRYGFALVIQQRFGLAAQQLRNFL
jgi:hypothetical protein